MAKKSRDWESELEEEANRESAREKARGGNNNNLSIKNRRFTFGGENLGRELKGVVVEWGYLNQWYKGKYKEDQASIPACFALSMDGEDMAPHENSAVVQNDTCEGCEWNEWGSSGTGTGRAKACRQGRRLAIIHEDDIEDADSIAEAEIAILSIPPTTVKNWASHVKACKNKLKRPVFGVLTKISFDMDADYPVLEFEAEEKLEEEIVEAIMERREDAAELIMKPFEGEVGEGDDDDEDEKPSKRKRVKDKARSRRAADSDDDGEEDSKARKKNKPDRGKAGKKRVVDDEDEEDIDEEEEDEDEDKKTARGFKRKAGAAGKRSRSTLERSRSSDVEEDDEDEEDEDEEKDDTRTSRKASAKKTPPRRKFKDADEDEEDDDEDDEDEDEEDEEEVSGPKKRRKSRFA